MSGLSLKTYQWLLRAIVEILDIFPPRKFEKEEFALRKGQFELNSPIPQNGTIWVHGASLGEVITLRPLFRELARQYGRKRLLATSTTMDGLRQLRKDNICANTTLLPIELPAILHPFLAKVKPRVLLISETEIWPLLLATLSQKNIPYGIINGRINEKSVRMMRIMWSLFQEGIENISFAFVQEKQYQRRFKILGIKPEKLLALGCLKYDITQKEPNVVELKKYFKVPPYRKVICFGSTHPGEEEMILDAMEPIWSELNATIIIAPRHIKRVNEIETLLKKRSLNYSKLSENVESLRHVLLVDTLGELRNLYAISSLAFVGGSLIKRGGHNMMEPVAYGIPVIVGPHTFNFRYEMMALKKVSGVLVVNNRGDLFNVISDWMKDPEYFSKMAARAKEAFSKMSGTTVKTIKRLQELGFLENEK